jgi:diketogulonate reductase-like aldo/keto reductase
MEQIPAAKLIRYRGISNFSPKQVDDILKVAKIKRKVLQIELHLYFSQHDFVISVQQKGITVKAYARLGNTNPYYSGPRIGKILEHQTIKQIARARNCTPV